MPLLLRAGAHRKAVAVELPVSKCKLVGVLDARTATVENRVVVPGANLLQGIQWHPGGEFALFTLNRTKNLVPMTRLLQGWTITNGIGVVWRDGTVDQMLLELVFPTRVGVNRLTTVH